jgi:hypothetical protein
LIANIPWNTKINLIVKGEGGDPDPEEVRKKLMIRAWNLFNATTQNLDVYKKIDKWNRDETLWNGRCVKFLDRKEMQENFKILEEILVADENRLAIVTKECFDIMKLIENKIDYVNITKYKDDEEEWEYYQFGKNEYQADLFFARNTDRIKIMLNIIKKQNPKYKEKRCKLACEAAKIKTKMISLERDNPELLPILYEKKRRWKTAKRYMMKNLLRNLHSRSQVEIAKVTKWKKRHQLAKENKKMTLGDYIYFYHSAYDEYFDEYMEAVFYEEGKEVRMYEFRYENWYEQWEEDRESVVA